MIEKSIYWAIYYGLGITVFVGYVVFVIALLCVSWKIIKLIEQKFGFEEENEMKKKCDFLCECMIDDDCEYECSALDDDCIGDACENWKQCNHCVREEECEISRP